MDISEEIQQKYNRMFELEEQGDDLKANEVRSEIQELLSLQSNLRERRLDFFERMEPKPFISTLKDIYAGKENNRDRMAIALSSFLTHSIIEKEQKGDKAEYYIDQKAVLELLNRLIKDDMSLDEAKNELLSVFPELREVV